MLIGDRWVNLDMLTCEIHFEKGKPLSLANAHTSREQVASAVCKVPPLPRPSARKKTERISASC
jgi:hypothetical protein